MLILDPECEYLRNYVANSERYIGKYDGYYTIKGKAVHRFIINCMPPLMVDHKNRNRMDNRKCNLRVVTSAQNCFNRPTSSGKYPGIHRFINKANTKVKREANGAPITHLAVRIEAIKMRRVYELEMYEFNWYDCEKGLNQDWKSAYDIVLELENSIGLNSIGLIPKSFWKMNGKKLITLS